MFETELVKLREFGILPDKINEYQVLCLPENVESASSVEQLFDADDAVNLSKQLKAAGIKCGNSFDLGLECGVLERRGEDLWLGLIWIVNSIAIPLVVSTLGSILASIIRSKSKRNVHLSLYLSKSEGITKLKYDGDPETLLQLLKNVGDEKKSEGKNNDD